jgi:neutral ceramidase
MPDLYAASVRADISPPVGIRMWGYTVQEGVSVLVQDPLTATGLLFATNETRVFIVGLDLLGITDATAMREAMARELSVDRDSILLNCSHTHSGPMLPGWQQEDAEQARLQSEYLQCLGQRLVQMSRLALERLRPARVAAGHGYVRANINRREKRPDGSILLGFNSDGPRDESVAVLRVDDLNGEPLAIVFGYGAHPVTMGPLSKRLSPDFVGSARQLIENDCQCLSIFLQCGGGNMLPITGIGGDEDNSDEMHRVGRMIGAEVIKTTACLQTSKTVSGRRFFQSVAPFVTLQYQHTRGHSVAALAVTSVVLDLAHAPLPSLATATDTLHEMKKEVERARATGQPDGAVNVAIRNEVWARTLVRAVETGKKELRAFIEVGAVRVGQIALTAIPMEMFAETGLAIKKYSKAEFTIPLGYTNGLHGYLPTPEAFVEGGMEVNIAYRNYNLPTPITPEWEPAILKATLKLVEDLFAYP